MPAPPRSDSGAWAALALCAVLAVAATWPLASCLGLGIPNPDTYGNAWALAWVVHQATSDPLHLYDANVYWPHRGSFAFTESLFPQAVQAAPVLLAGGSALLAHNLVLLLTFPLAGLGAYLLAREASGSRAGALVAALGYAFCAHRFSHLVHVQALSTQWLPFALFFLLRSLRAGRGRDLFGLFACALAQALSSGYAAVLLVPALGLPLALAVLDPARRRRVAPAAGALVAAALLAALAYLPQWLAQREHGLVRGPDEVLHWSARWSSWLEPGGFAGPHLRPLDRAIGAREPLYPGTLILLLAAAGAWRGRKAGPARLFLLLAVAGVLVSLGPAIRLGPWAVPGPFALLQLLPGAGSLRTPARLGVLGLLALDVLAAIGWAALARRAPSPRVAGALIVALTAADLFPAGVARIVGAVPSPPAAARWLATAPRGPVLELPWTEGPEAALYVYWSTVHWQPMVNGWGAFEPPGNFALGLLGQRWPSPYASRILGREGVRYVVVHLERLKPGQHTRLLAPGPLPPGVELAGDFGGDRIYRIDYTKVE